MFKCVNNAVSCRDTASVVDERMSMEHRWNDIDRVKPKYSERKLS
jgi:hypothetical protein